MERAEWHGSDAQENVVAPLFRDLSFWPGVAALSLHLVLVVVSGVFWLEDATGWHSCWIDTCEDNHVGSPFTWALIFAWGGSFMLSFASAILAGTLLCSTALRREKPNARSLVLVALSAVSFVAVILETMVVSGSSLPETLLNAGAAIYVLFVAMSVTSGFSFVALGYGIVVGIRERRMRGFPALAITFGAASLLGFMFVPLP